MGLYGRSNSRGHYGSSIRSGPNSRAQHPPLAASAALAVWPAPRRFQRYRGRRGANDSLGLYVAAPHCCAAPCATAPLNPARHSPNAWRSRAPRAALTPPPALRSPPRPCPRRRDPSGRAPGSSGCARRRPSQPRCRALWPRPRRRRRPPGIRQLSHRCQRRSRPRPAAPRPPPT